MHVKTCISSVEIIINYFSLYVVTKLMTDSSNGAASQFLMQLFAN